MVDRIAEKRLKSLARQFRVVAVNGPRQSGKSTLVKKCFPNKEYVSLEGHDIRSAAIADPRRFLSHYIKKGAILDEVQRVPEIFSYLQEIVDEHRRPGHFILTGSNNFLMQESITQSLAGRVGYLTLLPLTLEELSATGKLSASDDELIFRGFYPELFSSRVKIHEWYPAYVQTYLERDVRALRNITNLQTFTRLVALCAGRVGQLLNMSALAVECGTDVKTIQAWLSVLESSYVIFFLRPYHVNYNKRIVKMPKLYFYDTGLACSLLEINEARTLRNYPLRGALFENLVIADVMKRNFNEGTRRKFYFWRDKTGHEIDLLEANAGKVFATEIKSGKTFSNEFVKHLGYWKTISHNHKTAKIVYAGKHEMTLPDNIELVNFRNFLI